MPDTSPNPSKALFAATALQGRNAVVTGAARGIGRATALALAAAGADVVGLDLCATVDPRSGVTPASQDDLTETGRLVQAEGRRWHQIALDQRDRAAVRSAAAVIDRRPPSASPAGSGETAAANVARAPSTSGTPVTAPACTGTPANCSSRSRPRWAKARDTASWPADRTETPHTREAATAAAITSGATVPMEARGARSIVRARGVGAPRSESTVTAASPVPSEVSSSATSS